MKIASWNVNGIRAVHKKGFMDWLQQENADIVCLQETKAFPYQLSEEIHCPSGYQAIWHQGTARGYAGTVIYLRPKPLTQTSDFGDELTCFHEDGRVVEAKFPGFRLLNIYFPNGSPNARGEERLSYKLEFYDKFLNYVDAIRAQGEAVIVCGDFNICHREIDIARPQANKNSIGFLPVERACIDRIIEHGYLDVFRHFYPQQRDAYTWWTYRAGARERNVGWRIDYFFMSDDIIDKVENICHQTEVMGSDHCPLVMELND